MAAEAAGDSALQAPVETVALGRPQGLKTRAADGARTSRLALAASLGAILLFVLVITLPFSGQAFHIDDAIFWDFARADMDSPFQQYLPDYKLIGRDFPVFRNTHPPLVSLMLSAIMRLGGEASEKTSHLSFIIFPALAGISMFFLARRFTSGAWSPLLASLLMMATPVLMVMSHTLMGDVPMTSFWLAAMATYIYGVDRDDSRLLVLAGALATLAVFTGYQALALILLLPLYALLSGRLSLKTAVPLLLPLLAFGWYVYYNLLNFGALPRYTHSQGLSLVSSHILDRVQGTLLQTGGATVFPLLLLVVFSLGRKRFLLLPVMAGAAVALAHSGFGDYSLSTQILYSVFMTTVLSALAAVIIELSVQATGKIKGTTVDVDSVFLGIWLLSLVLALSLLLPHATARYCLPFLAPLILLLFRELELRISSRFTVNIIAATAVVLTFFAGMAVSAADYQWAQSNKDYVQNVVEKLEPQGDIWFVGEWGFRHYMESRGYRYLTSTDTSPRDGDLVIRAGFSDWPLDRAVTDRMHLISTTAVEWQVPLRVMSFETSAGFYGSHWGLLPYAITGTPVEEFEVYQISDFPL